MNKKFLVLATVLLIIVMTGCSIPEVKVEVSSSIEFYSPVMSSVPGLPINVNVEVSINEPYDISIEMKTDNGTILEWGSDMKVNDMGQSVIYHDGTRYWSPFDEELGIAQSAEIEVKVTVKGTGLKTIVRQNIHISKNSDDMYILDPGD